MNIDPWLTFHGAVAAILGIGVLGTLRDVFAVPALEPLDEFGERGGPAPSVAVVVPARDEEARIHATVTRLLEQRGIELEVIVVDDRSRDRTREIVAAIAARDAHVRLVHVETLPETWLGKPHACQRGGEATRAEWILFTDGDIALAPDVLARALRLAQRERVEHVVLAPDCPQQTFWAQVLIGAFGIAMLRELSLANRDSSRRKVGIGAFNLVRADAWRAIGGHQSLAYEVVDDLRLGLNLRRAGFRTRGRLALRDVSADWGGTVPRIFAALEKNMFAEMRYSIVLCSSAALFVAALFAGAVSGPFLGTTAGWCAFAALLSFSIPGSVMAWREDRTPWPALFVPLGFPLLAAVMVASMIATLARGGVVWRGRLYPLELLRARRVRGW